MKGRQSRQQSIPGEGSAHETRGGKGPGSLEEVKGRQGRGWRREARPIGPHSQWEELGFTGGTWEAPSPSVWWDTEPFGKLFISYGAGGTGDCHKPPPTPSPGISSGDPELKPGLGCPTKGKCACIFNTAPHTFLSSCVAKALSQAGLVTRLQPAPLTQPWWPQRVGWRREVARTPACSCAHPPAELWAGRQMQAWGWLEGRRSPSKRSQARPDLWGPWRCPLHKAESEVMQRPRPAGKEEWGYSEGLQGWVQRGSGRFLAFGFLYHPSYLIVCF